MDINKPILHVHLESTTSTNDYVREHASEYDVERLCVLSSSLQTKGRGTKGSSWHSLTPHNIYASFFFETDKTKDLQCLAQILSLSTAKVIERYGFCPTIKWPNDVLLEHKKIGGVLCEIVQKENNALVILGIGLNVNMPSAVLEEIDQPANSLFASSGKIFSTQDVLKRISEELQRDLEVFLEQGFAPFCDLYNTYMVYRDLPVAHKGKTLGFSERVTDQGLLECRGANGEVSYLSYGSIQIRNSKHSYLESQ